MNAIDASKHPRRSSRFTLCHEPGTGNLDRFSGRPNLVTFNETLGTKTLVWLFPQHKDSVRSAPSSITLLFCSFEFREALYFFYLNAIINHNMLVEYATNLL